MKRIALAVVAVLALGNLTGCSLFQSKGDLDAASVEQLRKNHDLIFPRYIKYVEADGNLSSSEKQDEKDLIKATNDLTGSMIRRLKED